MKLRSLVCLAAFAAAGAQAQELENGTHYRLISPAQPTSAAAGEVEVTEFFQYGCGGCFQIEPHLTAWRESRKPDHVNLVRVHVVWNPLARLHAQAFYAAEALGKSEEMNAAFFDEIHRNGNSLETEAKLAEFFGRFGVEGEEFERAFGSFSVHAKVQRADELTRRYRVAETPTLIVAGKYLTTGAHAGSYDNWFEIVNRLAAAEHGEQ